MALSKDIQYKSCPCNAECPLFEGSFNPAATMLLPKGKLMEYRHSSIASILRVGRELPESVGSANSLADALFALLHS